MSNKLIGTHDRKVSNAASQFNTFGLLPGPEHTCPFATAGIGGCLAMSSNTSNTPVCYVYKFLRWANVRKVLQHNTGLLMNASKAAQTSLLKELFNSYLETELKRAERAKQKPWLCYRVHWSGDIFSNEYARALASAMQQVGNLHYWIYTRSFKYAHHLAGLDNCTLNLSIDAINLKEGIKTYNKLFSCGNVKAAYMSAEKPCGYMFGSNGKPAKITDCPVDNDKLPLDNACSLCKKCIVTNKHPVVWLKS